MCRSYEGHAALCNGAAGQGLRLGAYLIHDDYLGHVVLHCLNLWQQQQQQQAVVGH
jgi:hypothetical protein